MQKQAPTVGRIMVMAIFTLSCFGLLLYLWAAFGGPVPLKPHGYRFNAVVRGGHAARAGGRRPHLGRERRQGEEDRPRRRRPHRCRDRARRAVRPDAQGQPRDPAPEDAARARPTSSSRPARRAPATSPRAGGSRPPRSRRPSSWTRSSARSTSRRARGSRSGSRTSGKGIEGHGADFSDFLGVLPEFANNTNEVLKILNSQERAVQEGIKNTGVVFDALTERDGQLAGLDHDLEPAARRRRPAAMPRSARHLARVPRVHHAVRSSPSATSRSTRSTPTPLMRQLRPVGTQLSNLLVNAGQARRPTSTSSSSGSTG